MCDLAQLAIWKQSFGLLPIHLSLMQEDEKNYILLNGGYGDFCLATHGEEASSDTLHSKAWSSSTKNFVSLDNDNVSIYNWEKRAKETIKRKLVEDNLAKFYKYLTLDSSSTNQDIVPYLIDIFRQFRNYTQEKQNGVEALNLLFVLLAGLEDDVDSLNSSKWGLSNIALPNNFDQHIERLKTGIYTPNLNLILRHSAGRLFQEAQKEVLFFDNQINLFGEYSSILETKKNLYTSIHYTPSYLSRTIVENTIKKIDLTKPVIKIFDPACGSAEFLIEALKQLGEKSFKGNVTIVGWDSSQTAINTSLFLLTYEKRNIWRDRLTFDFKLVNDSLQEQWDTDFDAILMNPPFISWEQLDKNTRESVYNTLNFHKKGKPNIAAAFFYKAIQSLNKEGAIGCILPTSFLTFDTYKELRDKSYEQITFDLIGKLGNFVFEDALTDVSIIIGHKPKSTIIPYVLWVKNERNTASDALRDLRKMYSSNDLRTDESNYSIYQPHTFPIAKENWKPISYKENEQYKKLAIFLAEKKLVKLQDIFTVNQGVRTGNNKVFIISSKEFNSLPSEEKSFFRPSIDNKSIKNGLLQKINYIWYPYSSGGMLINDEDQLKKMVPTYYENKLLKNKNSLSNRARKDITNWWYLSEHRAWLIEKKMRLVSTEFGGCNSFALDELGEFAIERGNGWSPKQKFLDKNAYYFYLAIFSSSLFEKLLSIYSKQLAGGKWYDLGKKYTKEIPIPNVHSKIIKDSPAYNKLVNLGKDLSEGYVHSKSILDDVLLECYYPHIQ